MIYLYNNTASVIVGAFNTISLAKEYLNAKGITEFDNYSYLQRIEDMSYISRICDVDDVCIYNNKTFWLDESHTISDNFESYTVTDVFGNAVDENRFNIEMNNNALRLNNIYTIADEVAYNIKVGFEFISLFRETCVSSTLGSMTGLEIAQATANLIPLVMTGSFDEAGQMLAVMTRDDYLTDEKLMKYRDMLMAADVITYNR